MLDLEDGYADFEINSPDKYKRDINDFTSTPTYSFDETTKLYLCSGTDGVSSALSCTISHLQLTPIYPDSSGNLGDLTRMVMAL